jgi:hypothetical protein
MTTQHTPGPWSIDPYLGVVACGRIIALTGVDAGFHRDANARLIAAAPDLLEVLKKSREGIESMTTWEHADDPARPFSDCLKLIDAAIAKATGDS